MRAMELNDMAVAQNKAAFEWGRHCAVHWELRCKPCLRLRKWCSFTSQRAWMRSSPSVWRFLTDYQNAAYANRYRSVVERVRTAEAALNKTTLTEAVARNLFKLMAYKDEYEVARLHTDTAFLQKIDGMFEGDFTLNYHLAPPLIAKTNAKGELQKQKFGPLMLTGFKAAQALQVAAVALHWMCLVTPKSVAPSARSSQQYQSSVDTMLGQLNTSNHALAWRWREYLNKSKALATSKPATWRQRVKSGTALKAQWSAPN